jgi:hypothetical protein
VAKLQQLFLQLRATAVLRSLSSEKMGEFKASSLAFTLQPDGTTFRPEVERVILEHVFAAQGERNFDLECKRIVDVLNLLLAASVAVGCAFTAVVSGYLTSFRGLDNAVQFVACNDVKSIRQLVSWCARSRCDFFVLFPHFLWS